MLTIQSGPAHVLANGFVTAFCGHPVRFCLELPDNNVVLELSFETDEADPRLRTTSEPIPGGFHIRLYNFDGTDGKGSARPVLIGDLGADDLLFVHFRVFRFRKTIDRTVNYSFYQVNRSDALRVVPELNRG